MEKYAKKCSKFSETKFLIQPLLFIFTFFGVIHLVEPFLYVCSRRGHLEFRPEVLLGGRKLLCQNF